MPAAPMLVIPATRNPDHMIENLAAGFGCRPDAEQRRRIRPLRDRLEATTARRPGFSRTSA